MGETFNIPFRNSMKVPLKKNRLMRQKADEKLLKMLSITMNRRLILKPAGIGCLLRPHTVCDKHQHAETDTSGVREPLGLRVRQLPHDPC